MGWEAKYSNFGVVKIEGKNVKVFSDKTDYITIELGEEEAVNAYWAGDYLKIRLKNGKVRRYSNSNYYITI